MKKTMALLMAVVIIFGLFSMNIGAQTVLETTAQTSEPTLATTTDTQEPTINPITPIIPGDDTGNGEIDPTYIGSTYSYVDVENGYYYLNNIYSKMYMDIHGPNTDMIHQWTYHNGKQEIWYIQKVENTSYYTIQSQYSGKYLGIANTNVGEANINQYAEIADNTYWRIKKKNGVERYVFEPKAAVNTFLNAPDANIGSELQLAGYIDAGDRAQWELFEVNVPSNRTYFLQNIETTRIAGPYGPYTDDGTTIHQWDFGPYDNFRWLVEFHTEDFSCTIKNVYTNKYLGYASSTDEYGNYYIEQYTSNTSANTRWRIYTEYDGNLTFVPRDYEKRAYLLSVDPYTNDVGSYLKLVAYVNDDNHKDEWELIYDFPYAGTIADVWYSDVDVVGYWANDNIKIYTDKLDNSNTFLFDEGVADAKTQWGNALGVSFSNTLFESNANIEIYGGTTEQIEEKVDEDSSAWTGITFAPYVKGNEKLVNINNSNVLKYVVELEKVRIYIKSSYDAETIRQTIIHELGHGMGFYGHPTEQNNVMNSVNGVLILTSAEKQHLQEIYYNFTE